MNDYYLPQIDSQKLEFPNPKNAIDEGLLARGGDLSDFYLHTKVGFSQGLIQMTPYFGGLQTLDLLCI